MIRSFSPHPKPLPPGERGSHSSPQQSWGILECSYKKDEDLSAAGGIGTPVVYEGISYFRRVGCLGSEVQRLNCRTDPQLC